MKNVLGVFLLVVSCLILTILVVGDNIKSNNQYIPESTTLTISKTKSETVVFLNGFHSHSLADFIRETYHLKNKDTLRLISYGHGGNAYICIGMINHIEALKARGVRIITEVQSMALSANAYIWLIGDERIIHRYDLLMTHHAIIRDHQGNAVPTEDLPQEQQMLQNLLKIYITNKLMKIIGDREIVNQMLDDENNWYVGYELWSLGIATKLIEN